MRRNRPAFGPLLSAKMAVPATNTSAPAFTASGAVRRLTRGSSSGECGRVWTLASFIVRKANWQGVENREALLLLSALHRLHVQLRWILEESLWVLQVGHKVGDSLLSGGALQPSDQPCRCRRGARFYGVCKDHAALAGGGAREGSPTGAESASSRGSTFEGSVTGAVGAMSTFVVS